MIQTQIFKQNISKPNAKALESETLKILPWEDLVTDTIGYDPRSLYVEMFWLPVLGPSCIWLIRRLAMWLENSPTGFELNLDSIAKELGLGTNRKSHPLKRTLIRCSDFGILHIGEHECAFLRLKMPQVSPRLLNRFSDRLKQAHAYWISTPNPNNLYMNPESELIEKYLKDDEKRLKDD